MNFQHPLSHTELSFQYPVAGHTRDSVPSAVQTKTHKSLSKAMGNYGNHSTERVTKAISLICLF